MEILIITDQVDSWVAIYRTGVIEVDIGRPTRLDIFFCFVCFFWQKSRDIIETGSCALFAWTASGSVFLLLFRHFSSLSGYGRLSFILLKASSAQF